ncbi:PspC domain-containing protein [Streptosporangium sp. NPDC048865]|uniref:PspC domain-containing protein n=1 Tax=Streptosporangium sp. NPDC048865 TaxID=3155766 RepID=UPI0034218595
MRENDFTGVKKLQRTRDGRIVAGVASGLGRYIGVDPNIIRAALAIATFFGGLGVAVYAIGWILLPDENKDRSVLQDVIDKNKDNPIWVDARAKAEQGWAKATNQHRASQPASEYPTHQAPFPPVAPQSTYPPAPPQAPYGTAPRQDDDTRPQA